MNKLLRVILLLVYVPVFIVGVVVIHELGHTGMARLLGDARATFVLVEITEDSRAFGRTFHDETQFSQEENLVVSLSGLLATQLAALVLLAASGWAAGRPFLSRLLAGSAIVMAIGDVFMQGSQGLLYDISERTWPSSVDLVDVMLLAQQLTGASQATMKVVLGVVLALWVVFFVLLFRRVSRSRRQTPALVPLRA